MADPEMNALRAGVSGRVLGSKYRINYRMAIGRSDRQFCCYTHTRRKHQAFQVAHSERVHCANAYRLDSSISSFATKPRLRIYRIHIRDHLPVGGL
jgi:hypothetical protein